MIIVVKYSAKEWAKEMEGISVEEFQESIVETFGKEITNVYFNEDSAVVGCQFVDGTYGAFGCRMDTDGLSYDEMLIQIECGK